MCAFFLSIISSSFTVFEGEINQKSTSYIRFSGYSPTIDERRAHELNSAFTKDQMKITAIDDHTIEPHPPPPPVYFTGYKLPPGNPCETFTLPPPPADKKRTGPRRMSSSHFHSKYIRLY